MIKRSLSTKILELSQKYPVISITGPRQSGKTSLAKYLFPTHKYVSLENTDVLSRAHADARTFLQLGSGKKMIIDEIQKCPELLSYMQEEVDTQEIEGQFVVTGSQNFAISESISQSLAGRVANFVLLPLSLSEMNNYSDQLSVNTQEILFRGFYPRPLTKQISPADFYQDYMSTYVERDVRQIKNIGDLLTFQKCIRLLAGRVGQLINYSSLANYLGVSYKTIESWLSVLQASYICYVLPPFFENWGKRLIKSSKVYFYDVGLLCYLLGISDSTRLSTHYAYGQIFENLVILEILKGVLNKRSLDQLYFFRDSTGNEVDLIVEKGAQRIGIEIKSSGTFHTQMFKGLDFWKNLPQKSQVTTMLLYDGKSIDSQKILDHEVYNWQTYVLQNRN